MDRLLTTMPSLSSSPLMRSVPHNLFSRDIVMMRSRTSGLIHAALHPYPEHLVLVSKVGAERDAQGGWIAAQRPEQLRAGVEANLRSLAVERLDVVNLRLLDAAGYGVPSDQGVDLDSQLAEMVSLRNDGKIGGIGISNVTLDQLRQALPAGLACVQNGYSLLDRSNERQSRRPSGSRRPRSAWPGCWLTPGGAGDPRHLQPSAPGRFGSSTPLTRVLPLGPPWQGRADRFPEDVLELQGPLGDETRIPGVYATPGKRTHVPLYILSLPSAGQLALTSPVCSATIRTLTSNSAAHPG
jgi:hypothetical protein